MKSIIVEFLAQTALTVAIIGGIVNNTHAQVPEANYDESKVSIVNMPELLKGQDGAEISTVDQWPAYRHFLVQQLSEYVYGYAPTEPVELSWNVVGSGTLGNTNVLFRELDIVLRRDGKQHTLGLILFLPSDDKSIKGCFLMPNFQGNHALTNDKQIRITKSWMRESNDGGVVNNLSTEESRGNEARRAPIELITSRGYMLASVYYGDIDPDFDDGFHNGVHALYPEYRCDEQHPNRWGSIAAWAWGLSRCLDCIQQQPEIRGKPTAVVGHSRLGKTALWAGATDERFAIVISNDSGCGGAALSRRNFGETVWRINTAFPHWFNDNFPKYKEDPAQLPVDQHQLIASIAPRPVYVASASNDRWADPKGEYLAAYFASPAYVLHGKKGLDFDRMPELDTSVGDSVGYHIRTGDHDLLEEDWLHYLNFVDRHWAK